MNGGATAEYDAVVVPPWGEKPYPRATEPSATAQSRPEDVVARAAREVKRANGMRNA